MSIVCNMSIDQVLIHKALEAKHSAYAPYSNFKVGAAILGENGKIYHGCNVENISFGATICAERSAICSMVVDQCYKICKIAVASQNGCSPCGICLQSINEFVVSENIEVIILKDHHDYKKYPFSSFIKKPFNSLTT